MTAMRRMLAVLGLAVAVVVGSSIPASATFSDTARLATNSVGTLTVDAPGGVTGKLTCGGTNSTMSVTWNPSGTRGVSGYRVIVLFSDGFEQIEDVTGAATGSWSKPITTFNVTKYAIQYSVTTLTTYGWSAQSGLTGSFRC
jgi:hypothetical protein